MDVTNAPLYGTTNGSTNFTDYDYEIVYNLPLEELVPNAFFYGATLLLGLIGNILVIFSVSRFEQMMTITNTFLLSLATADLLLVLVCVPVKVCIHFLILIVGYPRFINIYVHNMYNSSAVGIRRCLTTVKSFLFAGHLIQYRWWVGQSTN